MLVMAKKRMPVGDSSALSSNPFAGLGALATGLDDGPEPTPETQPAQISKRRDKPARLRGKIVIRRQRKGHGGKTVTCVEGLRLPMDELEQFAKDARTALGCGGHVDGDVLVLAGEQAPRVEAWLRERGAKKIVIGN